MIGPHTPILTPNYAAPPKDEQTRIATFMAGYDAGRNARVVVLSDDTDWLDGFITGRSDRANA